jgi:spermidine/putrescine transport system ATP-binding protein
MSVADNIGFGLEMQGKDKASIKKRTHDMLELVQLGEYANRKPNQLSGGQQQRVALARALAPQPEVLLLDEPLSALDLKLRKAMRIELKQIQENAGITFIFVTHDQEEALTMSDRIAVMSQGEVQQLGTAEQIYQEPKNRFVADFIGESNLIDAVVSHADDKTLQCRIAGDASLQIPNTSAFTDGTQGTLCIRPERVRPSISSEGSKLSGTVESIVYLGTDTQILVSLNDQQRISCRTQNASNQSASFTVGQHVGLHIDEASCRFLPLP